jgi:hypothetical protein
MTEPRTSLKDRVTHVLDELRVILPGTQAIIGFQLVAVFSDGFTRLSSTSKYVHFASLLLVCLSAALLMTPASYHRIANRGNDSEELHQFATVMLILAMAALAMGISADLFVISWMIFHGAAISVVVASTSLVGFFAIWFGYPVHCRARHHRQ